MDQTQDMAEAAVADPVPPTYAYKPSLMGAPWEFWLKPDRLMFVIGRRRGEILYQDIQRVRLSFRPATMQSHRFIAEIWSRGAPKLTVASASWHGIMEQRRQDQPYRDFIAGLHQRIADTRSSPVLEAGAHPILYWPGLAIFAAIAVSIVVLLGSALRQNSWPAMFFLAGFFALMLWQIGGFFRRNRPCRYEAGAIPEIVLPKPER